MKEREVNFICSNVLQQVSSKDEVCEYGDRSQPGCRRYRREGCKQVRLRRKRMRYNGKNSYITKTEKKKLTEI